MHGVHPFYESDGERISVSGNFYITDELNHGHPLQKGEFLLNNQEENNAKI